ncbi:MAG TPA: TolC family protein, partial [Burkholderiaceae bacterium]|nr:TolC family protein [Burkholderiaceae bacterium]
MPALLLSVSLAGAVRAQTSPALTLEETQRLARARAPQLAGFESAAAAARDMAVAAEQRPDPVLKLGIDN